MARIHEILNQERVRRELANNDSDSERRVPAESGSVQRACSGALTWTAEKPKRRGWWWWEGTPGRRGKQVVEIFRSPKNNMQLAGVFDFGVRYLYEVGGRWAGPLPTPKEPSDEASRQNTRI